MLRALVFSTLFALAVRADAVAAAHDLGMAPMTTAVDIAVVLRYRHVAELDRLIDAQTDPASPLYHHFLTQPQFRAYFSPTSEEYGAVANALQRGGFSVTHTSGNRTVVDARAPAPVAARYFGTSIHLVQTDAGIRYINVHAATLPPELRDRVVSVVGLDTVHTMHPDHVIAPAGPGARPPASGPPLFGPDGGYGPQVLINSYDLPAAQGITGQGHASAVVADNDFADSDLAAFLGYFGITRTGPATVRTLIDGGGPPSGDPSIETTLDVEALVSLAPGTALYLYNAPIYYNLADAVDAYNQVVIDNVADTVNTSYGECETGFGGAFPPAADAVEKQGNAEGITFHAATGDTGVYAYGCGNYERVDAPASTPHSVAVGGTNLTIDKAGFEKKEIGWDDEYGATGGGVSLVFGMPKFQKGIANIITTGRNIPDIAFDASPLSGFSYYIRGTWAGPIGGTSLASPIAGAAITEMNQLLGSRMGDFNATLYRKWKKTGYSQGSVTYFRDIKKGTIIAYKALPGYDQMSGIGVMQASNFEGILP